MIEVLQPGLLTTVQDLGRDGFAHLGVSAAGAADPLALRVGNLLVGNREGAAALELSIVGGAFLFHSAAHVAIVGAASWSSFFVEAGATVSVPVGARSYLCVGGGGIVVPQVLGSASTHLPSGLGGYFGRALRKGDRLDCNPSDTHFPLPAKYGTLLERRNSFRVTAGQHLNKFRGAAVFALASFRFRVQPDSNRQGLRLGSPEPIGYPGEVLSEGAALGSIQVPPDGSAIILFVDSQTTGGYPVIATVISADLPSVGQLKPGDRLQFVLVTMSEALAALREQEALLGALRRELA